MVLDLSAETTLRLPVRRIRIVLLLLVLALLVLDEAVLAARFFLGHGRLGGMYALFDLDVETSVSTFVQSSLLLVAAVLLWLFGRVQAGIRTVAWILAAATLWVAADEASQIHELLIVPLDRLFGTGGVFRYGWVIPGLAVAVAVVVLTIRLLRVLDRDVALLLALGGGLYLLGVLGVEMAGGAWLDGDGSETVYRMVFTSIEETLEGAGIVVAVAALLEAVRRASPRVLVDLTP